nr:hypothetical protein [Tanacetum cinerariifolium]
MTSLADKAILSGADNRLPMLEKDMYDSWKIIMELYMLNRQHGRMILESFENGLLLWPTSETEITSDSNIILYSQYVSESQYATVQNSNFPAQQDALILSVIQQLKTKVVNCTKINQDNKSVNETLNAELERYKDQLRILKKGNNVDKASDLCARSM